jgi:uncharacterized YkwD family protein
MNKQQPKKGFKKTLIVGVLALTLSIPVGASAASAANTVGSGHSRAQVSTQYNIDLDALIQQFMREQKGNWSYTTIYYPSTGVRQPGAVVPSKPVRSVQPVRPAQPAQPAKPTTGTDTLTKSKFASQVLTLVNKERSKVGLKALKMTNSKLNLVALDKARDMYKNGYFDHTSPTYGSPFDMMKKYGVSYTYAGENIAKGQTTPQAVMTAWMNSNGHRANILNANFTTIGVAYYNNIWVQEFIS